MQPYTNLNRECGKIPSLLSEYVDDTLSGRQVWEVEKHLAECADCAALLHEMRATVQLMQAAPHYDTSDDFMAKLHTRLDTLEPQKTPGRPRLEAVRDWLADAQEALRTRRAPALAFGTAMLALAVFLLLPRPVTGPSGGNLPVPPSMTPPPTAALQRSVALAANNPLDDPAAANLEAHTALTEANSVSESDNMPY